MRIVLSIILCLFCFNAGAQHSLTVYVKSLPDYHQPGHPVYMAGSFNNWNPGNEKYRFKEDSAGHYSLTIELLPGKYEYKITRGTWQTVECGPGGRAISNRSIDLTQEIKKAELDIQGWADHFPSRVKATTAGKNVQVMDSAFRIRQLDRYRKIWIYLPAGYHTSGKKYPVLYMHDGQNLFDDAAAFSGEWGIDEFMDTTRQPSCIVVGIENSPTKRLNEYNPYDHARFGKGEGKQYTRFIAKTLRPYVNKHYRTLKEKESTYIAGSSMGGLISLYAILRYPKRFGGAAVFSPSFAVGQGIFDDIRKRAHKTKGQIYFYAGKQEGDRMVPDVLKAFENMSQRSKAKMITVIRDEGKHNEETWRKEFPLFYEWLKAR